MEQKNITQGGRARDLEAYRHRLPYPHIDGLRFWVGVIDGVKLS